MLHVQEIPREQRHHRREAERARQNSRYAHIRARMMSRATEYKPRYARKCERERAHRAEVEEMRWRIEEARSFFDPEFFM